MDPFFCKICSILKDIVLEFDHYRGCDAMLGNVINSLPFLDK